MTPWQRRRALIVQRLSEALALAALLFFPWLVFNFQIVKGWFEK